MRLTIFMIALWAAFPVFADEALKRALEARAAGDWPRAVAEARRSGPLARDIIEWHRLRARQGTFAEARAFLAENPDWPGLPYLRQQSESSIGEGARAADVLAFFEAQLPRTGNGALRYAEALAASGRRDAAQAEIVRAWTTLSLRRSEEARFLDGYRRLLVPHHAARADMLLWRGLSEEAERMVALLPEADAALTRARIALRERRNGVDALIEAVPASRADHPGLAFERFLWRVNRGRMADAIALMEGQEDLGEAEAWGNLRRRYARQLMRAGEARRAYRLASRHGLSEGRHYADLEWLSGYIALRKLRDADTALRHFERFEKAIDTPISLGRAAYWQARAHAQVGNDKWAREDYLRAAEHQTSFYGQLAAEAIGAPMDPALAGREEFPPWREAGFTDSSVFQAALLLLDAGDLNLGERFLTHLTESLDREDVGSLAQMAEERGEAHLQVMIGKRAVQYGMVVEGPYFALHPLAEETGDIAPELALAIARRESEFDPRVSSGVGARGLMQLMPPTAREMAGNLSLPFIERRLVSDPDYNARLGLAYIAELQTRYGDSPILISVAYNAGPSRADSWIARYGDPRSSSTDLVDWIEGIPFRETRNYVMRVTESLPIYRARLTGETDALGLLDDLRGARPTGAVLRGPEPPDWAPEVSLRPQPRPSSLATR